MSFFSFKNGIIVSVVAVFTILGFYWADGYSRAKVENESLFFRDYLMSDFTRIKEAIKEIPAILKESAESGDKIKIGSINKLVEVLDIYNMEEGKYPETINDLIGKYVNSGIVKEESFYYEPKANGSGYTMGIKLGNGEIYEVKN
jgi:hypothetical protein